MLVIKLDLEEEAVLPRVGLPPIGNGLFHRGPSAVDRGLAPQPHADLYGSRGTHQLAPARTGCGTLGIGGDPGVRFSFMRSIRLSDLMRSKKSTMNAASPVQPV